MTFDDVIFEHVYMYTLYIYMYTHYWFIVYPNWLNFLHSLSTSFYEAGPGDLVAQCCPMLPLSGFPDSQPTNDARLDSLTPFSLILCVQQKLDHVVYQVDHWTHPLPNHPRDLAKRRRLLMLLQMLERRRFTFLCRRSPTHSFTMKWYKEVHWHSSIWQGKESGDLIWPINSKHNIHIYTL